MADKRRFMVCLGLFLAPSGACRSTAWVAPPPAVAVQVPGPSATSLSRFFQGAVLEARGDWAGAASAYEAARVLDPVHPTILAALERVSGHLGDVLDQAPGYSPPTLEAPRAPQEAP